MRQKGTPRWIALRIVLSKPVSTAALLNRGVRPVLRPVAAVVLG